MPRKETQGKPSPPRDGCTIPSLSVAMLTLLLGAPTGALGEDAVTIELALKEHKFEPPLIKAPAGSPISIKLKNYDATPEEFDSTALKVEKIVTGNGSAIVRLKPLTAGRYPFRGEYHESTAQGVLVIE